MTAAARLQCPSGRAVAGAKLIGVVTSDVSVDILPHAIDVDEAFLTNARSIGEPDARFRFANTCVMNGCNKWADGGCGLVRRRIASAQQKAELLPACPIRHECRWFTQEGADACEICSQVVRQVKPVKSL